MMIIKQLAFTKQAPRVATLEELAKLEAKISFHFPPAFVEFCQRWNGGFPSEECVFYPVPPQFEEFHQEYKSSIGVIADIFFGATEEFPQCSLLEAFDGDLGIVPITEDLLGNQVVLRTNPACSLVYWHDHERWESPEEAPLGTRIAPQPYLIPIAENLESFYNGLTCDPNQEDE